MKLPKAIRIGTQTYRVLERDRSDDAGLLDALAYTLVESNLIVLRTHLPADRKKALLFHEALHAVVYTYRREDTVETNGNFDEWEHYFIGLVKEPVLLMLRDNPELVEYLTGE